ncbi:hypothetical protein GPECTOR_208g399 [Gonium pectorale]|uniref:Uncharacterized protein n=1 Tax=Gonium pectorale TaxID=33097 RepID=A0A150FWY0_GONPE|nr:hypothetical protein GPECTOR_208g399 [Gonium pectorale]|eukprot:KXZ42087.1 hypothetical protein GPECTOR_208g399 [Gonium pectorale]
MYVIDVVLPAVLQLLNEAGLDAEQPHLLSDYHYHCTDAASPGICPQAPSAADPRCLPCPGPGPEGGGRPPCPCRLPPGCTQEDRWATGNCSFKGRVLPYDQPLADGPRRKGYGFTDLTAARSGLNVGRYFGTFSEFNDVRTPAQLLGCRTQAAKDDLVTFRAQVSVHVRTAPVLEQPNGSILHDFLPPYLGTRTLSDPRVGTPAQHPTPAAPQGMAISFNQP